MSNMGDLNDEIDNVDPWIDVYYNSQKANIETHTDHRCGYKQLRRAVKLGDTYVYILFRVCKCGQKEDLEYLIEQKMSIYVEDFREGLEIHLSKDCSYNPVHIPGHQMGTRNQFVLKKICYCPW